MSASFVNATITGEASHVQGSRRQIPLEILLLIIDNYLDGALDSILRTFRFIRSLRTTAHPTPTLGSSTALCIDYPRLDLVPLLLTSRTLQSYIQSHPDFSRIYIYHPICHFKDINLPLKSSVTNQTCVVPFTIFPLRSGNALYGFNKPRTSEMNENILAPKLRIGTVSQLAEILIELCGKTGLEEMSLLVRGDYLVGMIKGIYGRIGAWQRRMMKENMVLEWVRDI